MATGKNSGLFERCLTRVVGVLIEAPVMLSVVRIANASKFWYEARI
ncbi:MAG: hypothetical protein ACRESZ_12300 [Methylococcales bacterium]